MREIPEFRSVLRKTAWRIKLQQVLERVTTTAMLAVVTFLIGLYYYKTWALGASEMWVFLVMAGSWLAAGVIWGLLTKTPDLVVASRLDAACGLNNALGSALEFAKGLDKSDLNKRAFMEAEIQRAKKVLPKASARKAAPFRWPRDLTPTMVLVLFLAGFAMVEIPLGRARAMIAPPPKEEVPALKVESSRLDEHLDVVKDLQKRAKELDDKKLQEFLKKQADLIKKMKQGKLSRRDFMKNYSKLMNKYFKGEEEILRNFEKMKDLFKKAADPFLKHKITKELGKALKKGDMKKARKEIEKLVKKMKDGKLTKTQEKRFKKALQKAAEKMQKDKLAKQLDGRFKRQMKQLQRKMDKLDKKIRRLQQKAKKSKDPNLKRRINRMKQQKRRLGQQKKQIRRQQRMVRSLQKQMKKAGGQKLSKKMQAELRKLMKQMSKYRNGASRSRGRSQGRMSMKDLKEMLKRMRAQQRRWGKGRLRDFLDRAKGRQGRGRRPGGKGGKAGGKGGKGGKGGGMRPGLSPGGGQKGGLSKGKGQGGQKGGKGKGKGGNQWGTGKGGDVKGRETSMDSTRHEKHVKGTHGKGPSADQVVSGSAEKGFNTTGYRKLYVRYRKLQKEVLQEEDIPAGYRYYIKRYFRLIRSRK